jgi:F-type H+-transporting ATPase subunit gamma
MASLRDIRKRIKSVKNTQKITKAMKMVSAAKLRRAQERVLAARPFADKLTATAAALAKKAEALGEAPHPLLLGRPESKKGGRVEALLITSDRGLCGAFNTNVMRRGFRFRFDNKDQHKAVLFSTVGRKATEACKREGAPVRKSYDGVWDALAYDRAREIAFDLTERYISGELDSVHIVYNAFVNAATQKLMIEQILPVEPKEGPADATATASVDYEYEPDRDTLLEALLPRQLATRIYRALLESQAAEHAARMSAMDNASRNAKEMVDRLTLFYNRARQAAITKELMEIIGGAEALKG